MPLMKKITPKWVAVTSPAPLIKKAVAIQDQKAKGYTGAPSGPHFLTGCVNKEALFVLSPLR
jgi:hypothetical protein